MLQSCVSVLEVTKQALRNVKTDKQLQCEIFKVKQTLLLYIAALLDSKAVLFRSRFSCNGILKLCDGQLSDLNLSKNETFTIQDVQS